MRRPFVVFGLAAGLYFLLTIALTWPLVLHMGSRVPNDPGDSLLNTFLLAWNAREVPFTERWWNLPQFYPIPGALAFSEHLLGLSLLATPVILASGNPLFGYNVAFFMSFPLCALAAHLLVYELVRRHDIAMISGLAYAFAPYRMSHFAHVQVLSGYWMPLSLLGLHLFLRTRQRRWLALFGISWSLQALACGYYLFYLSVLIGLWLLWFAVGRVGVRDTARILLAWAVAAAALAPVALGYLKYSKAYGLRRASDEIQAFSADVGSLLSASGNLRLWGWLNVVERPESQLFPGLAIVATIVAGLAVAWSAAAREHTPRLRAPRILLAGALMFALVACSPWLFGAWKIELLGVRLLSVSTPHKPLLVAALLATAGLALHPSVRTGWRRRSALAFYSIAACVLWLFSLGPSPTLMHEPLLDKAPYAWLMMLPGVAGVRVPARFWGLATMCLAVAAALGAAHIRARWRAAAVFAPLLLAVAIVAESWPEPLLLHVPPSPRPIYSRAVARLELPMGPAHDLVALYRAAEHRRPVLNGYSGYFAPHYGALQDALHRRDGAVLDHVRSLGAIEVVVDHANDADGGWRAFLSSQSSAELAEQNAEYSVYRLPRGQSKILLPRFDGPALPISGIQASLYQDLVDLMLDGDLVSRWHTGGPQGPTNQLTIDLGALRRLHGIELQIGGYLADFPRQLVVDLSEDGALWSPAFSGGTARLAFAAALEFPLSVPLRFSLHGRNARYVRMRQTGEDPVFYWTIAELRVYGQ